MGFTCYCTNLRIIAAFARLTIGTLDSIYIAHVSTFAKDRGVKHICYLIRNPTIGTLDSIYIAHVSTFTKDRGVKHICYLIRNPTSRDTQRDRGCRMTSWIM